MADERDDMREQIAALKADNKRLRDALTRLAKASYEQGYKHGVAAQQAPQ